MFVDLVEDDDDDDTTEEESFESLLLATTSSDVTVYISRHRTAIKGARAVVEEVVHMVRIGNIYNTTILTISLKRTTKPTLVKGLSILFK